MAVSAKRNRLRMETLEDRTMFDAGLATAAFDLPTLGGDPQQAEYAAYIDAVDSNDAASGNVGTISASYQQFFGRRGAKLADRSYSTTVPGYSSNPGAQATIYLDFDGNYEPGPWKEFENIETPVFDTDGSPGTFSPSELEIIHNTYLAVAEDFAPFNVNVTTVDPEDFSNGKALRVAIGGDPTDWYGSGSGISSIGAFTNEDPNVVFVFSELVKHTADIYDRTDAQLALMLGTTASHEAGHGLGLSHQSKYVNGVNTQNYNKGTDDWTPIMGYNLAIDRTTWYNGPTPSGVNDLQDDMAVIARDENGFGYRADDHGNTMSSATELQPSVFHRLGNLKASGIIEQTSDQDFFHFHTERSGYVTIDLDVAEFAPNLDTRLELWSSNNQSLGIFPYAKAQQRNTLGQSLIDLGDFLAPLPPGPSGRIGVSDPAEQLGASITANLLPGDYYIAVNSHGTYGDVGQFTLTVKVPSPAFEFIAAPYNTSFFAENPYPGFGEPIETLPLLRLNNRFESPLSNSLPTSPDLTSVSLPVPTALVATQASPLIATATRTARTEEAAIDLAIADFGSDKPGETSLGGFMTGIHQLL